MSRISAKLQAVLHHDLTPHQIDIRQHMSITWKDNIRETKMRCDILSSCRAVGVQTRQAGRTKQMRPTQWDDERVVLLR